MLAVIEFFQRLYHFEELIRWGGHAVLVAIVFSETGIMAGFFLPGDSLLATAGLLASQGCLDVRLLIVELCIAAILGDSVSYAIGRKIGPPLFSREDSLFFRKSHLRRAHAFYERYGAKTIVLARFIPIIRTFAPVVAGVGEMAYKRFVTYNIVGGMAWVTLMILTGFWLGRVIPNVEQHIHEIILIVILLSILPGFIEAWRDRRRAAQGALR
ncbi:MAG TPA: VTT domain-containing protein [Elusimicrobiota bacterium]|nr:VTT domain-containing protein [Elusimicrobiota bacterium]